VGLSSTKEKAKGERKIAGISGENQGVGTKKEVGLCHVLRGKVTPKPRNWEATP